MQQFKVQITGTTPYLQHRMDDLKLAEWEKNRKQIIENDGANDDNTKIAMFHSYVDEKGNHFLPAAHLLGSFQGGGAMVKSKVGNARKSMKNIVAAMFFIGQEEIPLPRFDTIDRRSAVNKAVKARVMVTRPKWTNWKADFTLKVDNDSITKETIKEILTQSGQFIGIGSYRPTNGGSFGRYEITTFEPVTEKKK